MDDATPPADAQKLRTLLAVAVALRRLAGDAPVKDASLYLAAAGSRARRAARLAGILPQEEAPSLPDRTGLHRPVDIFV
jgi:hypothetical protein